MSGHHFSERHEPRPSVSRRLFLGASGAVGAATLVPGRAGAAVEAVASTERTQVVVVGAGLAGLVAARLLHRRGVDVVVLEAGRSAGGRVTPAAAFGETTVPAGHEGVLGLARDLRLGTGGVDAGRPGTVVMGGTRRTAAAGSLSGAPDVDREVGTALAGLNLMAAEVDPEAPWAAESAGGRDEVSLGSWIAGNVGSEVGLAFFSLLTRAVWAAEPSEISLLHALATMAGAGGAGPLVNASLAPGWKGPRLVAREDRPPPPHACRTSRAGTPPFASLPPGGDAAQQVTVEGGAVALVAGLWAELAGRVRLSAPVRRIGQSARGVVVEGEGFTVQAERAIVALPPAATGRIVFEPGAPASQADLGRISGGDVVSVVCTYGEAFWEQGERPSRALATSGPLTLAEARRTREGGVIVAHACGAPAREWSNRSEQDRRRGALDALRAWFGPGAERPQAFSEHDWRSGPSAGAGWSVVAPPGAVTSAVRALRRPLGNISWAGTERATSWAGRLEGAVRSGERAADEVVAGARPSALRPGAGAVL